MEEDCAFPRLRINRRLVNQSSQGLGLSFCAFDVFLNPERVQDVQRKFAYEIVATSNCRLRQNAVCAALPNVVLPGWVFPRFDPMAGACTRGALTTSLIQERSVEIRVHSAGGFGELKEVHA